MPKQQILLEEEQEKKEEEKIVKSYLGRQVLQKTKTNKKHRHLSGSTDFLWLFCHMKRESEQNQATITELTLLQTLK